VNFDNSYAKLPEHFYARVSPAPAPEPQLLAWNQELAEELGLGHLGEDQAKLARIFSGSELPEGAEPIALAYAGHQFGYFNPQLGDGRALLLGEVVGRGGRRVDLQLKGSGRTPFSRGGDGKAAIGPVIREYLLSEFMHRVGVPSTRALAAVQTGESVVREQMLPGAVLTRVAASHIRVGTFEYFAARRDTQALQTLVEYAIERHYPEVQEAEKPVVAFFARVVEGQARLIAHWMSLGFIHGVMNTDNTAISGETIDYGPCAFMDEFEFDKVFSSIDRNGRYAYVEQAPIGHWNLTRLAGCLMRLEPEKALFEAQLDRFQGLFEESYFAHMRGKLGLAEEQPQDRELIVAWLQHLQKNELDYTLSFRRLGERIRADGPNVFGRFEAAWRQRVETQQQPVESVRERMDALNPLFIPRNHQVERAIEAAIGGDRSVFDELQQVLQQPFAEQAGLAQYAEPPGPDERVTRTFCGT